MTDLCACGMAGNRGAVAAHILKDAHDDDINCVTWNHFDEHVLATGL